jgi:hypothetical protein
VVPAVRQPADYSPGSALSGEFGCHGCSPNQDQTLTQNCEWRLSVIVSLALSRPSPLENLKYHLRIGVTDMVVDFTYRSVPQRYSCQIINIMSARKRIAHFRMAFRALDLLSGLTTVGRFRNESGI